jgi:hypothetical protein
MTGKTSLWWFEVDINANASAHPTSNSYVRFSD